MERPSLCGHPPRLLALLRRNIGQKPGHSRFNSLISSYFITFHSRLAMIHAFSRTLNISDFIVEQQKAQDAKDLLLGERAWSW